jgi:hypothetical protein
MARMCIKTRRIDVALVCLGHMRNARAASAVRKSLHEPVDLQAACLAIQLDMLVIQMCYILESFFRKKLRIYTFSLKDTIY